MMNIKQCNPDYISSDYHKMLNVTFMKIRISNVMSIYTFICRCMLLTVPNNIHEAIYTKVMAITHAKVNAIPRAVI